jgi:Zn-dependent protease
MRWSFRVATVAGTEVRIHLTFFLLLAFVAAVGTKDGRGMEGALLAVLLVSAAFTCVLLHEFGHVFAARLFGIRTPDITLLPIGGMARLERMPRTPAHELVVALAGPAVNVVIAAVIAWVMGYSWEASEETVMDLSPANFWFVLMWWNLIMVVFNMVPAFPMDGGRVLRAVLAMVLSYERATSLAAVIGQGIAAAVVLGLLFYGIFNPILLLIAIFIFMAAGAEAAMVRQQEATRSLRVADAMQTEFHTLAPHAELRLAVDHLLAGTQQDFPVLSESGEMTGILSRRRLIEALAERGPGCQVGEVMQICPAAVEPRAALSEALGELQRSDCPALPVVDPFSGRLVGLLTSENAGETLLVRAALRKAAGRSF